jgi:hypothetical protein
VIESQKAFQVGSLGGGWPLITSKQAPQRGHDSMPPSARKTWPQA